MPSKPPKSCAVIGAGITGLLVSEKLWSMGWEVQVFESRSRKASAACSRSAAAMLAPLCETMESPAEIRELGLRSLELWKQLVAKHCPECFFQLKGSLVLAHPSERNELARWRRVLGPRADPLGKQNITDLEPDFAGHFNEGLYLNPEGQIDGASFMDALIDSLSSQGVQFHFSKEINKKFEWILDCRGWGGRRLVRNLRPVRGEIIQVHAPELNLRHPIRLLHPRYPIYVTPRPENRYLIGATSVESASERPVSVRSALELLSSLYSLHPGFSEAAVEVMRMGLRPAFPDHKPRIQWDPPYLRVNGLYRHGFLVGPALAERVAQVLESQATRTACKFGLMA